MSKLSKNIKNKNNTSIKRQVKKKFSDKNYIYLKF